MTGSKHKHNNIIANLVLPPKTSSDKNNCSIDKLNSKLKILPEELVFHIEQLVYHSCHNNRLQKVLTEFESFIFYNPDRDIGSIILARMDGMPLLD